MSIDVTLTEIDIDMAARGYDCVYKNPRTNMIVFSQPGRIGGTYVKLNPEDITLKMVEFLDGYRETLKPDDMILGKETINIIDDLPINISLALIAVFAAAADTTQNYHPTKFQQVKIAYVKHFIKLFN